MSIKKSKATAYLAEKVQKLETSVRAEGEKMDMLKFAEKVWEDALNNAASSVKELKGNLNYFGDHDPKAQEALELALDAIDELRYLGDTSK